MWWGLRRESGEWLTDSSGRFIFYPAAEIATAHLAEMGESWRVEAFA